MRPLVWVSELYSATPIGRPGMAEMHDSQRHPDDGHEDGMALASRWLTEHWDAMVELARQWAAGGATTPEDIAQEALLAAYERRDRLVDPAGERAWLLAFVKNKGREAVRRTRRRGRRLPEEHADLEADGNPVGCDESLRERILNATAGLPGRQEEIVSLVLDGWPDDEIAATTGLKKGTLRVYKHRAIRKLKELIR